MRGRKHEARHNICSIRSSGTGPSVTLTLITGYSGVAIYTRNSTCAPIRAEEGITGCLSAPRSSTAFRDLPEDQRIGGYPRPGQLSGLVDEATLDSEGRCVILEFPAFVLLGVYSPANRDESRDDFRTSYLEALDTRIRNLVDAGKQVIVTGDLNVIRSELDASNLAEGLRKRGVTVDEWASAPSTRLFNQLIFEGNVVGERDQGREQPVMWDICRCFHPTREGMNTCWDTKKNARPGNHGGRIDYILCTDGIKGWFDHADVQQGLHGSDHCPVYATMRDDVTVDGKQVPVLDLLNPPGVVENGQRRRDVGARDLLALSAKLIPEFDRRQSIRDMFAKKASAPASSSTPTPTTPSAAAEPGGPKDSSSQTTVPDDPGLQGSSRAPAEDDTNGSNSSSQVNTDQGLSPMKNIPPKRPIATATASSKSAKRPKLTAQSSEGSKGRPPQGQQTLRGFFKPKAPSIAKPESSDASAASIPELASPTAAGSDPTKPSPLHDEDRAQETKTSPQQTSTSRPDQKVFDPIEAKESWSKLLGGRVVPRCEHDEPCISLVTKKPGINCGQYIIRDSPSDPCPICDDPFLASPPSPPPSSLGTDRIPHRALVLHMPAAAGAIWREGEELGVEVRNVHLEQRLEFQLGVGEK